MGSYALIKIAPMIWRYLMKVGIAAGIVTICSMQKTAIATMKIIIALRAMNANAAFPHRRRKSQPQKIWGHLGQHRCKKMNDYHELIGWLDENIKDLEEWIVLLGNATDALFYSGQSDAFYQVKCHLTPIVPDGLAPEGSGGNVSKSSCASEGSTHNPPAGE